jgi:hypothetical protein
VPWILLVVAGLLEVVWAFSMKQSHMARSRDAEARYGALLGPDLLLRFGQCRRSTEIRRRLLTGCRRAHAENHRHRDHDAPHGCFHTLVLRPCLFVLGLRVLHAFSG